MSLQDAIALVSALGSVTTALVAVVALVYGYAEFVAKRAALPSVEFDVNLEVLRFEESRTIAQIDLRLKNVGTSILFATDLRFRLLYSVNKSSEEPSTQLLTLGDLVVPDAPAETFAGWNVEPIFWKGLLKDPDPRGLQAERLAERKVSVPYNIEAPAETPTQMRKRMVIVHSERTFVQPGVAQHYRLPVTIPAKDPQLVNIVAAFNYQIHATRLEKLIIRLLSPLPLVLNPDATDKDKKEDTTDKDKEKYEKFDWTTGVGNHTVRRVFVVSPDQPPLADMDRDL